MGGAAVAIGLNILTVYNRPPATPWLEIEFAERDFPITMTGMKKHWPIYILFAVLGGIAVRSFSRIARRSIAPVWASAEQIGLGW